MRTSIAALASGALAVPVYASLPYHTAAEGTNRVSIAGFKDGFSHLSRTGSAVCVSGTVSVHTGMTEDVSFNLKVPRNQTELTATVTEWLTDGSPFMEEAVNGTHVLDGDYDIGVTLCLPPNVASPATVQVLAHGIGFERAYWDFAPGYSYVDVATQAGYATCFYDRLGVGASAKPDGLNVVQTPLQVAVLRQLVSMLRGGHIGNVTFSTVVAVGHSYGSGLIQGLSASDPGLLDAVVLTGFSLSTTAVPTFATAAGLEIASQNQPYRFSSLSNDYLVAGTAISNQLIFFHAPGFDPNILSLADAIKGTVTMGELFTATSKAQPAAAFTGPLLILNGAQDFPFCGGNCTHAAGLVNNIASQLYPNVSEAKSSVYLAPMAGHGLGLHYSALNAYSFVQRFLKDHGL